MDVALVTAGNTGRLTGGNLYNWKVLTALRQAGLSVAEIVVARTGDEPTVMSCATGWRSSLARLRPAVVVVDSIALSEAAPLVSWIRSVVGARVLALMHMLPSEFAAEAERLALQQLEARLLGAADRVVAVSPSLRDRLLAAGADGEAVVVIPPGRDGNVPGSLDLAREAVGEAGTFTFLCVANWSPAKGIHDAVEALARLGPDTRLDLVGEPGDGEYPDRVRTAIRRNGLRARVHVFGPLAGRALTRRYAAADAFVLPSRSESFGIVYAEAMSSGLPVVAYRVGPLPWLVEPGCGLIVQAGDVEALAEAMATLAGDPALCRRMGVAARERARRLPTWADTCARFLDLVREALAILPT